MTTIFTPLTYLSLAAVLILVLLAVAEIWNQFYYDQIQKGELRVVEFNGDHEIIKVIARLIPPPFAMEVAVHQIGKDIHNYLIVPAGYAGGVAKVSGGKEVWDYNIYQPGGFNLAYSLEVNPNTSASLDAFLAMLNNLDFSKVDEIGEGAMFQLIFREKPNGGLFIGSSRILVSSSTAREANEIVDSLKKGLPGCTWIEEKDQSFIDAATYRELGPHKGIQWTI